MSTPKRSGRCDVSGFTLVELVIVIVVIGIMAAYAAFSASPRELSLPSQAETMASTIRHYQAMSTSGRRIRLQIDSASDSYSFGECVTFDAGNNCTAWSAAIQTVSLDKGMELTGTASVEFNTAGQPTTAATYTLSADGSTRTVSVAALTGHVSVTP